MRLTLNKRLSKLEQAIPSKAQQQEHHAAWREVFEEFGLPPDTPMPSHVPIIRQCIVADGTEGEKYLRLDGEFLRVG